MSIVIVGAGPNLGSAVARRFGREGLSVGLISRTQSTLDDLAAQLGDDGITARGAAADIRDSDALTAAIERLAAELGPVEVLEYSPLPAPPFTPGCVRWRREDAAAPGSAVASARACAAIPRHPPLRPCPAAGPLPGCSTPLIRRLERKSRDDADRAHAPGSAWSASSRSSPRSERRSRSRPRTCDRGVPARGRIGRAALREQAETPTERALAAA